jgi:hypothetical protein
MDGRAPFVVFPELFVASRRKHRSVSEALHEQRWVADLRGRVTLSQAPRTPSCGVVLSQAPTRLPPLIGCSSWDLRARRCCPLFGRPGPRPSVGCWLGCLSRTGSSRRTVSWLGAGQTPTSAPVYAQLGDGGALVGGVPLVRGAMVQGGGQVWHCFHAAGCLEPPSGVASGLARFALRLGGCSRQICQVPRPARDLDDLA